MTIKTEQQSVAAMCDRMHPGCIVCSAANAKGLHLNFEVADDQSVKAVFDCHETFEGYPGILHGGVIATLLDGAMGHCMFARGWAAVTVEMTTRFHHPVVIGKQAVILARITQISHPLYLLEAEIEQDGIIKAAAKSKFYHKPQLTEICEQAELCDIQTP